MNRKKRPRSRRKGSSLAVVASTLAILLVLGTGLLQLGLQNQLAVTRTGSEIAARSAADAGLTKALFEMNAMLQVMPWDDSTLPEAINQALANCDATFSYTVSEDKGVYRVESTGYSGQMVKTVGSSLRLQGPFEYAIFGQESVTLMSGSSVDWYNYEVDDDNLKVGTSSVEPSTVDLKYGSMVNGDLVVGVGGDPDIVIDAHWATVTGRLYATSRQAELPAVTVPAWLMSLLSGGTIENDTEIDISGKYDEIDLKTGKQLEIGGNVTLYVLGDIVLGNSASIVIEDDASLIMYIGGNLEGKNSSTFNNASEDPGKLRMYGLDSCTNMRFKNSSDFYGAIYAPSADVEFDNSADAYGAVAARSFAQKNSAAFNYDASLRDVSTDDEAVRFTVDRWQE